ncbi:MAG: excinuclease ABC subunit UvrA [Pirellulales bacterium]
MSSQIRLRGVAVHNLRKIDLDIPRQQLVVICGVSGSGKTSLALDTLYAEGQRRYIESFSAYTRQFLERLEKPEAESIEGLPPAVAVTHRTYSRSSRTTVGSATETIEYLRLLFAKIGQIVCPKCGREVCRDSPDSAAEHLAAVSPGRRIMLCFPPSADASLESAAAALREAGFVRVIVGERSVNLADGPPPAEQPWAAIVDRLTSGEFSPQRVRDSLETAFDRGGGRCFALVEEGEQANDVGRAAVEELVRTADPTRVDGRFWRRREFSRELACGNCGQTFLAPEPRLFNYNDAWGACPACEGFGSIAELDMSLIVPDDKKSLRDGAIAPWNTPAYAHELEELTALAKDYGLPLDVPFRDLSPEQLRLVREGVPERKFGGLRGFFAWLERKKYKLPIRVFLNRWRTYKTCPECQGQRLRPEALAVRIGGRNIAELAALKIRDANTFLATLELDPWQRQVARAMLEQVTSRLGYLSAVGLDYLSLDRTLRTLSGGEAQRVTLTGALGSSLVNMLYVLDEPSVGLHPRDSQRLVQAVERLRDRGNSVIVVEHDEAFLRAADHLIEIGPGAGERGGEVVFQGPLDEMLKTPASVTGDFLAGRRGVASAPARRPATHGAIRLRGARGHNLQNLDVDFPLGLMCLVTGVSGAGKSTLVQETLYPALCQRLRKDGPPPLPFDDVLGTGQITDVALVDQTPIGRSPRSNPVTYIKTFDDIRAVFAETADAHTRGFDASSFSFNVDGGRCPTCHGDGQLEVDMQFLADVVLPCPDCRGTRYRREVLQVHYRGRNIAEVLQMTVREAFGFFRGQTKLQARLKRLIDVGLDYLRLGQPAQTLSGGEAQRLKLAGFLAATRGGRSLLILDEPTTGLHFADVVQLLDCFEALLAVGHSLLIVEHNLQLMRAADYLIDLGPGPADEGGRVVVQGTPEEVAACRESFTGQCLAEALAR